MIRKFLNKNLRFRNEVVKFDRKHVDATKFAQNFENNKMLLEMNQWIQQNGLTNSQKWQARWKTEKYFDELNYYLQKSTDFNQQLQPEYQYFSLYTFCLVISLLLIPNMTGLNCMTQKEN